MNKEKEDGSNARIYDFAAYHRRKREQEKRQEAKEHEEAGRESRRTFWNEGRNWLLLAVVPLAIMGSVIYSGITAPEPRREPTTNDIVIENLNQRYLSPMPIELNESLPAFPLSEAFEEKTVQNQRYFTTYQDLTGDLVVDRIIIERISDGATLEDKMKPEFMRGTQLLRQQKQE